MSEAYTQLGELTRICTIRGTQVLNQYHYFLMISYTKQYTNMKHFEDQTNMWKNKGRYEAIWET